MSEKAGDEEMGRWAYCTQHVSVHPTGWCTVDVKDKTALNAESYEEAYAEARALGFDIYRDVRTTANYSRCTDWECRRVQLKRICPDCNQRLMEGPHGGLSVNFLCNNQVCGSGFNDIGPFGVDRITDAHPNKVLT